MKINIPNQKFANVESLSGILLFAASALALIWANSPYSDTYFAIWQNKITIDTPGLELSKSLLLWINDGLMVIFFFLVGLQIKRELLIGELNSNKKAVLPIFAAFGGMLFPILIYLYLNENPETANGWGISMATDIAFTLAVLTLFGKRIPISLIVFLTVFAIVDDIGAVVVIAIFYCTGIDWHLIVLSLFLLGILYYLAYKRIYAKYLIAFFGFIIWTLFLKSGIHPTVAGILLAFAIPLRQRIRTETYVRKINIIISKILHGTDTTVPILSKQQIDELDRLEYWTNKLQSPLQHLEHRLHPWVAYLIVPIFALSNAGVQIGFDMNLDYDLAFNIAISLILGNSFGVFTMCFLAIKAKIGELPQGTNYIHLLGISCLAGLGFTMSIFITNLAFVDMMYIDSAKIGILTGSIISGVLGYLILLFNTKKSKSWN